MRTSTRRRLHTGARQAGQRQTRMQTESRKTARQTDRTEKHTDESGRTRTDSQAEYRQT